MGSHLKDFHRRPNKADVGVTPLGAEVLTNVEPAHEADLIINHEDLTVVPPGSTHVAQEEADAYFLDPVHVQGRQIGEIFQGRSRHE